jgi:hypothetical protein
MRLMPKKMRRWSYTSTRRPKAEQWAVVQVVSIAEFRLFSSADKRKVYRDVQNEVLL